jgi:hypothetical protein
MAGPFGDYVKVN